MRRTILTPADYGGAALLSLRQWLAIHTDAQDALLESLLRAAADTCEAFTGVMPLAQACEAILPAQPGWQALPTAPVNAITAVSAVPAQSARFALSPADYEIDIDAHGTGRVRLLRPSGPPRIAVAFAAGLAPEWEALPDALRHGIVRLAGHLYRERDSGQDLPPPAAITALWRPWRRMRIA
ncbi:phage head-tail connector protein [Qipengyuania sp. JC766]|uniref:head-tail connector protein n=1 Tax=Qipengyuania sp. JC766 TaxID=3232139 RepID=UPI003457AE7F